MREIPEKLRDYRFSFIPVARKGKNPIIDEWQLTDYKHDDLKILQHLNSGANLGILCKEGIPTIIDFDNEEIEKEIAPKLPKTFTIKSGRGRMHKYYFCKNSENKAMEGCDILSNKKQAIIPPSTHPNGNEYSVLDNSPIATIDFDEVKAHFFKYWKQKEMPNTTRYTDNIAKTIKDTISISTFLRDCGIDVSINPTMCPLGHKSEGKKCFSFDDLKQVGYCFHRTCEKGGDIIRLTELKEKIGFKEALKWLSQKYNITLPKSLITQTLEKRNIQNLEENSPQSSQEITIETAYLYIRSFIREGFKDECLDTWVYVKDIETHLFCRAISSEFKDFTRNKLANDFGIVKEKWISEISHHIDSFYNQEIRKLHLRVTWLNEEIYYQINNKECIVIGKTRLEQIEMPRIFRVFRTQKFQKVDLTAKVEDYSLLSNYLNFADDQEKEIFLDVLPTYFVPEISKPIILVRGEAGSAKSTLLRMMKTLVDPHISNEGISIPTKEGDWDANLGEHYFLMFDNVGSINSEAQDRCCRIIQGMVSQKRKLYTDDEAVNRFYKSCLGINAIDLENLQSDFIDRSLIFDLKRVPDDQRKSEELLKKEFEEHLPRILGAIFKIIQNALSILQDIKEVPKQLRLIDFVRYSAAISKARGRNPDDFLKGIQEKSQQQKEETTEQSLIAQPLIKFMAEKQEWSGNMKDLSLNILKQEYGEVTGEGTGERITINKSMVPVGFPQDHRVFAKELARITFILKGNNITVQKKRTSSIRLIILRNEYNIRNNTVS